MDDNDIFESLGGSLLNDLLADLNAAVAASDTNNPSKGGASSNNNFQSIVDDGGLPDDLFALLEQELISTYADPLPPPPSSRSLLPGAGGMPSSVPHSSAAMVVNQHARNFSQSGGGTGDIAAANSNINHNNKAEEDVWSNSLSQFGNMSLAADFLAADSANKQQKHQQQQQQQKKPPPVKHQFDESLFDQQGGDEEYKLEEDVVYGDTTAIVTTLLGSAAGASSSTTTKGHSTAATTETTKSMSMAPSSSGNVAETNINAPLPPLPLPPQPATLPAMFPPPPPPPPHMTGFLMASAPPPIMHNNGVPLVLPPPQAPMMLNPMLIPPVLPIMGIPPHHQHQHLPNRGGAVAGGGGGAGPLVVPYDSDDFPALGSTTTSSDGRKNQEKISKVAVSSDTLIDNNNVDATTTTTFLPSEAQIIFNNTNPHTPPISAHLVQTKLMPFRDTCFIVNVMMRTLKSLDAYNDDYYHWSVLNNNRTSSGKSTTNHHPLVVSAMPGLLLPPPTPLLKGMKETVKVQEETYHKSVKARAKTFAEEQKSLGQLVRTNVKRPKALLDTPVLKREEDGTANATTTTTTTTMNVPDTTKYEAGQQVSRIHLWKARVAIDRGYTAFLSLMELRRLIQAQMRDPRVIQELMVDVKSNIDLLHSSLGVSVQVVNSETGGKTIEIDKKRLKSTLSLPKGKILCARAIEEGILPHPSACNLLPMALHAIFSEQMPSSDDDGEDRLLSAFTGLILTEHPGVDPMILCRCLEVATSFAAAATGGGGEENTNIDGLASGSGSSLTSSHMRVNLLHSVLTMGKHVCAASPTLEKDWLEKEQEFRGMLNLS